jgi:SepF-like predicted cell division protein (DUF552 family)
MEELIEDIYTTCSECGKSIPSTLYCIYCGTKLPENIPQTTPSDQEERFSFGQKIENIFSSIRKTGQDDSTHYFKTMPLRDLKDLDVVKNEVKSGNILLILITPLAEKSVVKLKRIINELNEFTKQIGGDVARLGDNHVIITPSFVEIWRKKTVSRK